MSETPMQRAAAILGAVRRLPDEVAVAVAGLRAVGLQPIAPQRLVQMSVAAMRFRAGALLAVPALRFGDATAMVDDLGPVSYAELDRLSDGVARAWRNRGIGEGDGIGILCRNHRWFVMALGAAAKIGARIVLLNTDFAGPQLTEVAERETVTFIVHDGEFADRVVPSAFKHGAMTAWSDDQETDRDTLAGAAENHPTGQLPVVREMSEIVLLTSGTTGAPKGAHRGPTTSLVAGAGLLSIPIRGREVTYIAPPFFHAWGLAHLLLALAVGSTAVTSRRFDAEAALRAVSEHRATMLVVVPTLLQRLLDADAHAAPESEALDLEALRIILSSGSQLGGALATATMDRFGDVLYNFYGSTEVASVAVAAPADLRAAPGCAGRPPRGVRVRILDDEGRTVEPGSIGRIFVDNGAGFGGYTGGGSKEVIDRMISTGDVGHFDEEGRLFVDGRADDMIVSGGENVFPREVEELLTTHPKIAEAAAIGVPDEKHGQRLQAFVVRAEDASLSEAEVRSYVRDRLARFKVPRDVVFVEALPRNAAGKVLKRELAPEI